MTYDELKKERDACRYLCTSSVREYQESEHPDEKARKWSFVKKMAREEKRFDEKMKAKDQPRWDREELGIE